MGWPEPICQLPFTVDDARTRFGWTFYPDDGMYPNQWVILVCDSRPIVVEGPEPSASRSKLLSDLALVVSVDGRWGDSEVALTRILEELGVSRSDLPWVSDDLGHRGWQIMRFDDNGNEFAVGYAKTQIEGEAVATRFRSSGHKQAYDVRRRQ